MLFFSYTSVFYKFISYSNTFFVNYVRIVSSLFFCNNNRNLLQSSSGLNDRIIVFVNPEAVIGG